MTTRSPHVYVRDAADIDAVAGVLEPLEGVARVLGKDERIAMGIEHPRSGDLVLMSRPNAWFAYPYWFDDRRAPDFARTVDIHRKPGYDPAELFVDPKIKLPKFRLARRLLRKKLGMRYLMDVVPLDPALIGGSHGLLPLDPDDGATVISEDPGARRHLETLADLKELHARTPRPLSPDRWCAGRPLEMVD